MSSRNPRAKGHLMVSAMKLINDLDNSVSNAQDALRQVHLVNNFNGIIQQYSVSAPVIATMRAVPEFDATINNFPDSAIYNNIPTNKQDERYTMALEALGDIAEGKVSVLMDSSKQVAKTFSNVVRAVKQFGDVLKGQLSVTRQVLESSDISDDEISDMETETVDEENLGQIFAGLESYFDSVSPFNVDSLRANPEKLNQEMEGIVGLVNDIGHIVGFGLSSNGLTTTEKSSEFVPSVGSFSQKGFDKANLIFAIDRAQSICDSLITMSENSDELSDSIENEASDIPEELESDDVTYGATEHISLMCCYATLMSKMLSQTATVVTDLISAVDPIVDAVEAGEDAMATPEEEELTPEIAPAE